MGYRTTRAVSFGGRRYEDHDPIPYPDHNHGEIAALFDKVRQELLDMGAIVQDGDLTDPVVTLSFSQAAAQHLREMTYPTFHGGVIQSLDMRAYRIPPGRGSYLMVVGEGDVPHLTEIPRDPTARRDFFLSKLRDGDDVTYLALTTNAAAELGQIVLFDLDPDTGLVTSAAPHPSAPIAGQVVDAPATGEAIQSPGAVDGAGQALPPVATDGDPADLATMTKAQLFDEAARIGAVRAAGMSKVDLIAAIEAKRGAA